MGAEIQQNVKEVKVIVEKYNIEFDLLMEVLSKSLTEKINEVRQEERRKAQDAINKQDLKHQEALKKASEDIRNKELALKQAEEKQQSALNKAIEDIRNKDIALKQAETKH
jgi:signal transduction histidine kinase